MEPIKRLRVAKNIDQISFWEIYLVASVRILLLMVLIWMLIRCRWTYVDDKEFAHLEESKKWTEDLSNWDAPPKSFASSWRERAPYINGSTYRIPFSCDYMTVSFCLALCLWKRILDMVQMLICFCLSLTYAVVRFLLKKYGWKNLLRCFLVCVVFSLFLVFGLDELLRQVVSKIFQDLGAWLDSRIYDATLEMKLTDTKSKYIPHPLTMGLEPPYRQYTFFRYIGEDVVFTCEYLVLGLENAIPIYKSTFWRKDGSPVVNNDKIFVSVNVTRHSSYIQDMGIHEYSILTTLTILLLEDQDYGSYTCDYYNPMRAFVCPGPSMSSGYDHDNPRQEPAQPMCPSDTCHCEPKYIERPPNRQNCQCQGNSHLDNSQGHSIFECFSEFILKQNSEFTIPLPLVPGSVLIDSAQYVTVGELEDIEFDVTAFTEDADEHNCCSKLVRLYWLFFRSNFNDHYPTARFILGDDVFVFQRWQCLCRSSFGNRNFVLYRDYFNQTSGRQQRVNIVYPVTLQLIPILSHPFSSKNWSSMSGDTEATFCWDSDQSSPMCDMQNALLDAAIDTLTFYENAVAYAIMIIPVIAIALFLYTLRIHVIIPLTSCCLNYGKSRTPFDVLRGPRVKELRPCMSPHNIEDGDVYDCYLSYNDEMIYDRMVAQYVKERLLERGVRTVFDPCTDVPFGRLQFTESARAIHRSSRFVAIVSTSYTENDAKVMEFDAIQQTIVSQGTNPKDRLLLIRLDQCEIDGFDRIPCIHLPDGLRDTEAIDDKSVQRLLSWEHDTCPVAKGNDEELMETLNNSSLLFPLFVIGVLSYFTLLRVTTI